jgi:hypothetical protein
MHRLHGELVAARAFLASLRQTLSLGAGATLEACTNAIAELMAGAGLGAGAGEAAARPGAASGRCGGATVVEVPRRRRHGSGDAGSLQWAGLAAEARAAERRGFPQVQIYVPAQQQPL